MKMPVRQYVDKFLVRLSPYPRQFIFVTSAADFDEVVAELGRRQTEDGVSNKWLTYKGQFRGAGICASGNGICVLAARYDPNRQFDVNQTVSLIGTMQHEIQHMLLHTCTQIGYNPMREHEPFTYLTKWVFEMFIGFMHHYHNVRFTNVPSSTGQSLGRLYEGNVLAALNTLPVDNARDSLAREFRAILGNSVRITDMGNSTSITYFES